MVLHFERLLCTILGQVSYRAGLVITETRVKVCFVLMFEHRLIKSSQLNYIDKDHSRVVISVKIVFFNREGTANCAASVFVCAEVCSSDLQSC